MVGLLLIPPFIGIGKVGSALADNLTKSGHAVTVAARDLNSESVRAALSLNSQLSALPVKEAISKAEVVFLATPYQANAVVLAGLNLAGKILSIAQIR